MAECDPDGRIFQMVSDMHACLAMELSESALDARREWERLLSELPRPTWRERVRAALHL